MADQKILLELQLENGQLKIATQESKAAIEGLGKGIEKASSVGSQGTSKLTAGFLSLKTIILAGVSAAFYKFMDATLGASASMEKNRLALEKLTGSADNAKKIMWKLTEFTAKTPLELPGAVTTLKQLLAFGVGQDVVIEKMRQLGDAAQGNQETFDRLSYAYGKVAAKGKASMEEINMFIEAGVPLLEELGNQYGVSGAALMKMIENGKVGFADVDKALEGLTTGTGKFAGIMEVQAQSLGGLWSTLKDNVGLAALSIGDKFAPQFKSLIKTLNDSQSTMNFIVKAFQLLAGVIGLFVSAIDAAIRGVEAIATKIKAVNRAADIKTWTALLKDMSDRQSKMTKGSKDWETLNAQIKQYQILLARANVEQALFVKSGFDSQLKAMTDRMNMYNNEAGKDLVAGNLARKKIDENLANDSAKAVIYWQGKIDEVEKDIKQKQKILNDLENSDSTPSSRISVSTGGIGGSSDETLSPSQKVSRKASNAAEEVAANANLKFWETENFKTTQNIVGATGSAMSQLSSILDMAYQADIARIDNRLQKQLDAINTWYNAERDAINNSLIGQDEKNVKLDALDKERVRREKDANEKADKQKRKIEHEQAKRQKAIKIVDTIIATAAGIMQAFQLGPIAGAIFAALIGAMGAAEIGIIASQPLPPLATGTVNVPKDMYAQLHQGEMVVPKTFVQGLQSGDMSLGAGSNAPQQIYVTTTVTLDGKVVGESVEAFMIDKAANKNMQLYSRR